MLRLLEFLVQGLGRYDFLKLFGKNWGEVCFKTPNVYVTFDLEKKQFTTERVSLAQTESLPTALVLPGGLLMVERGKGWQMYDPLLHTFFREEYETPPQVFAELKLPCMLLTHEGKSSLMNGLNRAKHRIRGGRAKAVSPYHLLVEAQARRFLYDLRSMKSVFVEQYLPISSRYASMEGEEKKGLLDRETGDLYWVDDIVVCEDKLTRYLLFIGKEAVGYVEGTTINWAHPSRLETHH